MLNKIVDSRNIDWGSEIDHNRKFFCPFSKSGLEIKANRDSPRISKEVFYVHIEFVKLGGSEIGTALIMEIKCEKEKLKPGKVSFFSFSDRFEFIFILMSRRMNNVESINWFLFCRLSSSLAMDMICLADDVMTNEFFFCDALEV